MWENFISSIISGLVACLISLTVSHNRWEEVVGEDIFGTTKMLQDCQHGLSHTQKCVFVAIPEPIEEVVE